MELRAPQSSGGAGNLGAQLLQLSVAASAQASQTIESIGARLLQLSEARKEREFTLQRDEASRDFTRERDAAQDASADRRAQAEQKFTLARDQDGQAFQLLLEQRRHELGMEDIERRATLQAEAELEQARVKEARERESNQRIADVVRAYPGLVVTEEIAPYLLSARFAKIGEGADAAARLRAQLIEEGHSEQVATDMAQGLLRPMRLEWVDRALHADAYAALQTAGDESPGSTLKAILGDLPLSQASARREGEAHVDQIIGGRIPAVERSRTGALDIPPGTQPGPRPPQPLSVVLGAMRATPASLGEDLHAVWQANAGGEDLTKTISPEWSASNWVLDGTTLRPRAGLDPATMARMVPGSPAHKFYATTVARIPAGAIGAQQQTSTPLTPTAGGVGPGAQVTTPPASSGDPTTVQQPGEQVFDSLLNIGPFRQQFGDGVRLPENP